MSLLFIGGLGVQEILLLVLVVLLFFGGRKIPEMMRGIGEGVRSFKDGMKGVTEEEDKEKNNPKTGGNKVDNATQSEDESK